MPQVVTDLRIIRSQAKYDRFLPQAGNIATNVQDAIVKAAGAPAVPTIVTHAMSPYAPLTTDRILLVDTSAGTVTIAMPSAATRSTDLEIKDDTGNAAANPVTVTFFGGETGDGLNPYPLDSNFAAVKFGPQSGGYYVHA